MDARLAKGTACRAEWGKSLVPRGRGAVTNSSPLWAAVSESRARLVNAFWEELPPPTPFVPCRVAAFSLASPGLGERKPRRGMQSTLYGSAGAGVGTRAASRREPVGARASPGPGSTRARGICHLHGSAALGG